MENFDGPGFCLVFVDRMGDSNFVHQTMLTCIGNKRKLVDHIYAILEEVCGLLGKQKLRLLDGFAGSTVVSRRMASIAEVLYTNDLELYSHCMAKCFLKTPTEEQKGRVQEHIDAMNLLAEKGPYRKGILSKLYAPANTYQILEGERCFYSQENAQILDTLRAYIDTVEPELQPYCLAPLLNKASIHTNTAGVFKGFYKDGALGAFGGKDKNALSRILKPIRLEMPIWSNHRFEAHCSQQDINALVQALPAGLDVIYLDPPYNQHPYGSNYFMLNVLAKNEEPVDISRVSGIPAGWNKSAYNTHLGAFEAMKALLRDGLAKAKYLLISYNNEGILRDADWAKLFQGYVVKKYSIPYDAYKGSRNLQDRSDKVMEIMYLVSMPLPPSLPS